MKELLNEINKRKETIEKVGYSFTLYDKTLNYLLSSKTKKEFLEKYKDQYDKGRNSIEIDENLKNFDLDSLKKLAIETVIDYHDAEIESIEEDAEDEDDED